MSDVEHGDAIVRQLSERGGGLDFAVNVNPLGPCPTVLEGLRDVDPHPYPDPTATRARLAIAHQFDVDPAQVILGNGATELLWTLTSALFRNRDRQSALVVEPAFGEVRRAVQAVGGSWSTVRLDVPDAEGLGAFVDRVHQERPALAYLAHPTSPWGRTWDFDGLADAIAVFDETAFIVDESFLSLSEAHADRYARLPEQAIRLRSLSKDLGLAGVRVAYAIAPVDVARRVHAVRPHWTVNAFAVAVVESAPSAEPWIAECRDRLFAWKGELDRGLDALGRRLEATQTTFGLIHVDDGTSVARALLEDHGIAVRDCTSFGLPEFIRVCARPPADSAKLVAALRQVLE